MDQNLLFELSFIDILSVVSYGFGTYTKWNMHLIHWISAHIEICNISTHEELPYFLNETIHTLGRAVTNIYQGSGGFIFQQSKKVPTPSQIRCNATMVGRSAYVC